jgi:hypothetical protein
VVLTHRQMGSVLCVLAAVAACEASEEPLPPRPPPPPPPGVTVVVPQTAVVVQQNPAGQAALTDAPAMHVTVEPKVEMTDGTQPTEFQLRRLVGHYATPDGRFGFILDRTASPPRIRLDGDRYVLALSPLQASKGWLEYTAGGIWMRLDEETGRILSVSFSGLKDATRVVRDGDAKPLPPP